MRFVRLPVGLALVGAVLSACKSTTAPPTPVPTSITLSATTLTLDALTATETLAATVKDQNGAPMSGQAATWSSLNPAIASVSTSGTVTAVANGQTTVRATSASVSADVAVTVSQAVAQLVKVSGDGQTGTVGQQVTVIVELRDRLGNVVPVGAGGQIANSVVIFAVLSGGGSASPTNVIVGTNGRASSTWTLGPVAGAQTLSATTAGGGATTTFTQSFAVTALAGTPSDLIQVSGNSQTGVFGSALPESLVVRVNDLYGNPVSGQQIAFAVTAGGGAVSPTGATTGVDGRAATRWTLGAAGSQTVTATSTSTLGGSPATFQATGTAPTPTALVKLAGDGLTGLVGKPVNIPPTVKIADQGSNGVAGVSVTFTATDGSSTISGGTVTSDVNGLARPTSWTLSGSAGVNTVDATSTGLTTQTFSATGQAAAYDIVVRYFGDESKFTAGGKAAFAAAAAKWQSLVFGDLQPALVTAAAGSCGVSDFPAISSETIDDIVIYAKADTIDGPNNILAQAGPCYIRSTASTNPTLTVVGVMFFDKDDLAALESSGDLDKVITHEMGHVLGYGTLWNQAPFSLLTGGGTSEPYFNGAQAIAAFNRVGGTAYVAGPKVPVENTGGTGTRDSHWRESVFDRELMTGFYDSGVANPLSIVTLGSLWDMGYLVNYSDADTYAWPAPPAGLRALSSRPPIELGDDIWRGPITVIDPDGRVVRRIRQ